MCLILSLILLGFRVAFISQNTFHFLSLMLIFELISIGAFLMMSFILRAGFNGFGCYVGLVFLVFCVAEVVIGLGLVVRCSRRRASGAVKVYSFMGV